MIKLCKRYNTAVCKLNRDFGFAMSCNHLSNSRILYSGKGTFLYYYVSYVMRKPAFCIWENKGADQLHSNGAAHQCLCIYRCIVQSLFFLNLKFQASSHLLCVQPGFCQTWSETLKTGFLVMGVYNVDIFTNEHELEH